MHVGAPLWEILAAGEWTSPAFFKYLDLHRLDTELVVQAHAGESDSDMDYFSDWHGKSHSCSAHSYHVQMHTLSECGRALGWHTVLRLCNAHQGLALGCLLCIACT